MSSSARTILITGATGTVSRQIIRHLADSNVRLVALIRNPQHSAVLEEQGIEVRLGDLEKAWTLQTAFQGIDTLWLVNPPTPRAPEQSSNAVWAARQAGVQHIVRLSVIGAAYDAPIQGLRLHALSDEELKVSGIEWTILRPHFFMQNLLTLSAPDIRDQGVMDNFLGNGRIGLIDARDIGEFGAIVLNSEGHAGKIYTLTGPESVPLSDVAAQVVSVTGMPVTTRDVVPDREYFMRAGADEWLAGLNSEFMTAYHANWGDFTSPDFESVTGRVARTLRSFITDHASYFRPE